MGESSKLTCPFCQIDRNEILAENGTFAAKWDNYPASPGHVLLIPRRHVISPLELTDSEWQDLHRLLGTAVARLVGEFGPDGFNIGFNIGIAAGQTIQHLHMHLIPRYSGDVEQPRGGIRNVVAKSGSYPAEE